MPIRPEHEAAAFPAFTAARQEERQGSLAGALDVLARATESQPDNPALLARYGARLRGAGRYVDALVALRRAAALVPDDRYVLLELTATLRMDSRVDEAVRLLDALIRRAPDDPDVVAGWALAVAEGGEPERALERVQAGVAADRGRVDLAITLGRVLVALGRHREALRRLDQALELAPRAYSGWVVAALARHGLGAPLKPAVDRAWALNEHPAWSMYLRGLVAEGDAEPEEAGFWYREALGAHARFHRAGVALGRLLAADGDEDGARELLRDAAATAPWDAAARGEWLLFRLTHGEQDLTLDRLEADALRRPHAGLAFEVGRVRLLASGDARGALPWLRRAAESAPDGRAAWALLRATQADLGDDTGAADARLAELAAAAAALDPAPESPAPDASR